ncbi:thioredoxin [Thalassotalea euphylliae]|uniref:thioredoxin n=1 Tax=Thalassotalea euphylliae TaxID=1655234 RepID=UPI00363A9E1A
MAVQAIDSIEQFAQLSSSQEKLVIDFWAPWCAPCNAMMPVFEQVMSEQQSPTTAVKVNVDELPALAQKFGVRTIPTIVVIEGGDVKQQSSGLLTANELQQLVN